MVKKRKLVIAVFGLEKEDENRRGGEELGGCTYDLSFPPRSLEIQVTFQGRISASLCHVGI